MKKILLGMATLIALMLVSCEKEETSYVKVDFDTKNEQSIESQLIEAGGYAEKPTAKLTKKDSVFNHWSLRGVEFKFDAMPVLQDIKLEAKWKFDENLLKTIKFITNSEQTVKNQIIKVGDTIVMPTLQLTKPDSIFDGWFQNNSKYDFGTTVSKDLTLEAHWKFDQSLLKTVSFDPTNGTKIDNQIVKSGNKAVQPNLELKKKDSLFAYWQLNGKQFNFDTKITDDINLVAKWRFNDGLLKTVKFSTGTDQKIKDQKIKAGNKITKPTTVLTKAGYIFKGWTLDGNPFNFSTYNVSKEITLVAKWAKTYVVSFTTGISETITPKKVEENHLVTEPTGLSKLGYNLTGWTLQGVLFDFNSQKITKDIILVAKWEVKTVTVSFKNENDEVVEYKTVDYDTKVTPFTLPQKVGKRFIAWQLNGVNFDFTNTTITQNIILTAKWEDVADHTVTFKHESWHWDPNKPPFPPFGQKIYETKIHTQTVSHNAYIQDPTTETNKFNQTGKIVKWKNNGVPFDIFTEKITSDLTLTPYWEANSYTVSFNSNGGTAVADQSVTYLGHPSKPADPTKEGYLFRGWLKGSSLYSFDTGYGNNHNRVTGDLTLTAKWLQKRTISFTTGTSEVVDDQIVGDGETVNLPTLTTIPAGKILLGWTLNGTDYQPSTPVTRDITLAAKWGDAETSVVYQSISRSAFNAMASREIKLVKATIHRLGGGAMWGTEAYLVDNYGNSSKNLYSSSIYGMFTFPNIFPNNDPINHNTFVFKLVKDTYMSSPQLGFGGTKNPCYDGSKWLKSVTYGIDYFDEVVRGTVQSVIFEEGVVKLKTASQTIIFEELTNSSDVSKLNGFVNKNVFTNCIERDGKWYSKLDHSGAVQVSETLGGTGNAPHVIK